MWVKFGWDYVKLNRNWVMYFCIFIRGLCVRCEYVIIVL